MKTDNVYLQHINESLDKILSHTKGMDLESFLQHELVQDSIIRHIQIIGEAAKKLSEEFRKKYPEIKWSRMASMRNKLIHNYFEIDLLVVWKTICEDIPHLNNQIKNLKS